MEKLQSAEEVPHHSCALALAPLRAVLSECDRELAAVELLHDDVVFGRGLEEIPVPDDVVVLEVTSAKRRLRGEQGSLTFCRPT